VRRYDDAGLLLDPPAGAPGEFPSWAVLAGQDAIGLDTDEITALSVEDELGGVWQTSSGNAQARMAVPSAELFVSPRSVTRNSLAKFRVLNGGNILNWTFLPKDDSINERPRISNDNSAEWEGWLVASGSARVAVGTGPTAKLLTRRVTIVPRRQNWKSQPANSVPASNGTDGHTLTDPYPLPGGDRRLGLSLLGIVLTDIEARQVVDEGPNHDLMFLGRVVDATTHKYIIHPGLQNSNSDLFKSQWGTFDSMTAPNGFISAPGLLQVVLDHETGSGLGVTSHYSFYRDALKEPSKNPLTTLEAVVAPTQSFSDRLDQEIAAVSTRLNDAHKVEPCLGGITPEFMMLSSADNCAPRGKVNLPPYDPRP
jgi:hypothetical protein